MVRAPAAAAARTWRHVAAQSAAEGHWKLDWDHTRLECLPLPSCRIQQLSWRPRAYVWHNMLSEEEAKHIRAQAAPQASACSAAGSQQSVALAAGPWPRIAPHAGSSLHSSLWRADEEVHGGGHQRLQRGRLIQVRLVLAWAWVLAAAAASSAPLGATLGQDHRLGCCWVPRTQDQLRHVPTEAFGASPASPGSRSAAAALFASASWWRLHHARVVAPYAPAGPHPHPHHAAGLRLDHGAHDQPGRHAGTRTASRSKQPMASACAPPSALQTRPARVTPCCPPPDMRCAPAGAAVRRGAKVRRTHGLAHRREPAHGHRAALPHRHRGARGRVAGGSLWGS